MADGGDLNSMLACLPEEDAVVPAAKARASERRLQLFHVSTPRGKLAIDAVQDVDGVLPVDVAKIASGLKRPRD